MSSALDAVTNVTDLVTQPLGLSKSAAEKAAGHAAEAYGALSVPHIKNLSLYADPTKFVQKQGKTELGKVKIDKRLTDAQFGALDKLSQISNSGGLTPEDRAQLNQISQQEATTEQGQRGAIMQNAAQRGIGGSGVELANLLGAEQGTANRASNRDLNVAALAQQRSLDALLNQAGVASNIRGQEYTQKSAAANAQDMINNFNTTNANNAGATKANLLQNIGAYNSQRLPVANYDLQREHIGDITGANADAAKAHDSRVDSGIGGAVVGGAKDALKEGSKAIVGSMF